MNIFLFIGSVLLFTLVVGRLLEKVRVPWIFAALVFGAILAIICNPLANITNSDTFQFLANFGMYMLLFLIGFELNVDELKERKGFIFGSTFFIVLFEGFVGSFIVNYFFDQNWIVSALVALSFATVGEAILIPILQEFNIVSNGVKIFASYVMAHKEMGAKGSVFLTKL